MVHKTSSKEGWGGRENLTNFTNMREKLINLIEHYISDIKHFGNERDISEIPLLDQLKENFQVLGEDSSDGCKQVLKEFENNHPENKVLLTDLLTYIKHAK
jgi:hypothetical protein